MKRHLARVLLTPRLDKVSFPQLISSKRWNLVRGRLPHQGGDPTLGVVYLREMRCRFRARGGSDFEVSSRRKQGVAHPRWVVMCDSSVESAAGFRCTRSAETIRRAHLMSSTVQLGLSTQQCGHLCRHALSCRRTTWGWRLTLGCRRPLWTNGSSSQNSEHVLRRVLVLAIRTYQKIETELSKY